MSRRWLALALLGLIGCGEVLLGAPGPGAGAGGGAPAAARPALTIVLAVALPQKAEMRAALERALASSFDLQFSELPSAPVTPAPAAAVELDLAAARKAYIGAEFGTCLARVGQPDRLASLLSSGKRLLAERALFWRIACEVGAGKDADARRDAGAFATFELEVPPDVEAAAPEVEALIAEIGRGVAAAPRDSLAVRAGPAAARAVVSLDGRAAVCAAPCTLDVHAGDHVVRVDADGFAAETRLVRVDPPGAEARLQLTAAGPDLAAQQWTARYAGGPAQDSPASVGLLAVATRARRLALVAAEPGAPGTRLTGVLAVDGGVAARAERRAAKDAELPALAPALARDLLVRGSLIAADAPLYKRPLFWVGVGAAAVAAAAVTTILLYHPAPQVRVEVGP